MMEGEKMNQLLVELEDNFFEHFSGDAAEENKMNRLLEDIEDAFFEHNYEKFLECLVMLARFG